MSLFHPWAQIAWAVYGFTFLFCWFFLSAADFSFFTFRGDIVRTKGRVIAVKRSSQRGIYAADYGFSAGSRLYDGRSYGRRGQVEAGSEVTVEYLADHPERSRIAGMRRSTHSSFVIVSAILPLIGLAVVYLVTKSGVKRIRLLRHGVFTNARVISKVATNTKMKGKMLWALRYEFTARDGRRYEAKATSNDASDLDIDSQVPVLYDPSDPAHVLVLPPALVPLPDGPAELQGRKLAAARAGVIPAIVIGAHALLILTLR